MNGVFVTQAQVKNVINSTARYGGRQLAQKRVLRMGNIYVLLVIFDLYLPKSFPL